MKIVINKCYGGFSLSMEGVEMLAKLQGRECYFFEMKGSKSIYKPSVYKPIEKTKNTLFFTAFDIPNPNKLFSNKNFHKMSKEEGEAYNLIFSKHYINCRPKDRTDKNLIKVVESLKEKANGSCAQLEIIDIPDGVEWEIQDYDGIERVVEKHRFWF